MGTMNSEVLRLQREMELSIQEKNYALAIVQSRQLLEMMVDDLCQKYNVHGHDLSDRIDALSDILSFETLLLTMKILQVVPMPSKPSDFYFKKLKIIMN